MIRTLLSDDLPRSRLLAALLVVIVVGLAMAPFAVSGARSLNTAATICVFIVLVASYDLLLGYTGIVSFAHTMFYGIGAYGVGLALAAMGPTWWAMFAGVATALAGGAGAGAGDRPRLAAGAGALLRDDHARRGLGLQRPRFAALRLHRRRGRQVPSPSRSCSHPATGCSRRTSSAAPSTGASSPTTCVYSATIALFLILLRVVNSHFGRVLQAIRENDFRAESLGYRTVVYRTLANCIAALVATLAGVLMALWLRYVGPKTMLQLRGDDRHPAHRGHRRHGHACTAR